MKAEDRLYDLRLQLEGYSEGGEGGDGGGGGDAAKGELHGEEATAISERGVTDKEGREGVGE